MTKTLAVILTPSSGPEDCLCSYMILVSFASANRKWLPGWAFAVRVMLRHFPARSCMRGRFAE
jgi:hypothetical protein